MDSISLFTSDQQQAVLSPVLCVSLSRGGFELVSLGRFAVLSVIIDASFARLDMFHPWLFDGVFRYRSFGNSLY